MRLRSDPGAQAGTNRPGISRRSANAIPNLSSLIQRTRRLRRELVALMERFPEDDLDLGDRIFVRLLSSVWRNEIGGMHGPYEAKQAAAVAWIEQYYKYLLDLEGYISGVLLKPDWFLALPLNGRSRPSAEECVRRLTLQAAALKRIQDLERSQNEEQGLHGLRARLEAAIAANGLKDCRAATGLTRDTINDYLRQRVRKPHQATVAKLEKYLKDAAHHRPKAGS